MKRKLEDDASSVACKKTKFDTVVPLEGVLSLLNLAVLNKALGKYCIGVAEGLALPETECECCLRCPASERKICEEALDKLVVDKINMADRDKYRIDVLMRELWRRGQTSRISLDSKGDYLSIIFHNVKHLSWFAIQILLFDSPVFATMCDLTSQTLKVVCKTTSDTSNTENNDVLREIILKYQKSVIKYFSSHRDH